MHFEVSFKPANINQPMYVSLLNELILFESDINLYLEACPTMSIQITS